MVHVALHILLPILIAGLWCRPRWIRNALIMLGGMLIDLDHLWATPIYDAARCSIGFHPLHSTLPIAVYGVCLLHPKTRILGLGLCLHILLDALDCAL